MHSWRRACRRRGYRDQRARDDTRARRHRPASRRIAACRRAGALAVTAGSAGIDAAFRHRATFNRIVTLSKGTLPIPAGYTQSPCVQRWTNRMRVFERPGTCHGAGASPFLINRVTARTGF
ncbi:MAG: hypothetical protein ACK4ZY_04035 [Sphingomonas sp.]